MKKFNLKYWMNNSNSDFNCNEGNDEIGESDMMRIG